MDTQVASARLRALAADDSKRSKAARLRDVVDDVEAALAAGVHRIEVLAVLSSVGLEMSLSTFETTLKRIRRKRRQLPTAGTTPDTAAGRSTVPATASHRPSELDQIFGDNPDLHALEKLAKRTKK